MLLSAVKHALRFPTLKIFSGPLLPSALASPSPERALSKASSECSIFCSVVQQYCSISSNARMIPQILSAPLAALNVGERLFVFLWVTCHVPYLGTEVNTVYASVSQCPLGKHSFWSLSATCFAVRLDSSLGAWAAG